MKTTTPATIATNRATGVPWAARCSGGRRLTWIMASRVLAQAGGEADRDGELGRVLAKAFGVHAVGRDRQVAGRVPRERRPIDDAAEVLGEAREARAAAREQDLVHAPV